LYFRGKGADSELEGNNASVWKAQHHPRNLPCILGAQRFLAEVLVLCICHLSLYSHCSSYLSRPPIPPSPEKC
jgi:hypothetical protein